MPTTTTMRHDSTGTRIDLGADVKANGLRIDEVTMQTDHAIVTRKRFRGPSENGTRMDFVTEDIHFLQWDEVDPEAFEAYMTGTHCIVNVDTHTHVYVPLNMAKAIADAVNADRVEAAS